MQDSLISPQESERLESIRREKKEIFQKIEILNSELNDITKKLDILCIPHDDQDPVLFRKKNAIKMFMSNPKSAIEFLSVHGIIDGSPESIAKIFIEENDHLCKTTIGNYIGEISKDFNLEVLHYFTKHQNFTGTEFVNALRDFLTTFNMPGESQKIDKILKTFSQVYHEQNPDIFSSSEDAYVLAYAAIMLNTTLYNENVKAQPNGLADEEYFVKTMMNYDDTTHLSENIVRKTYNSIKSKPIRPNLGKQITLGSSHYGQSVFKGFLFKMSGPVKTWKKRWFVLTDTSLLCFINSDQKESQSKGVIPLENAQVTIITNDRSKEFAFNIIPNCQFTSPISSTISPKSNGSIPNFQALFSDGNNNSGSSSSQQNIRSDHSQSSNNHTMHHNHLTNNHSNPGNNHSNSNYQMWRLAACTQEDRDVWLDQIKFVIDSLRANRTCFEILNRRNSTSSINNTNSVHLPLSTNLFDHYRDASSLENEIICPSAINMGHLKNINSSSKLDSNSSPKHDCNEDK